MFLCKIVDVSWGVKVDWFVWGYFDCVLFVDLIGEICIEVRDVRVKICLGNVIYD